MMSRVSLRSTVMSVLTFAGFLLIAVAGCERDTDIPDAAMPSPPARLTIVTPHNPDIRDAFELGFAEWRTKQGLRQVNIDWFVRGTPQCVRYIQSLFSGGVEPGVAQRPDLMFGGGIVDHERLAQAGCCRQLALGDALAGVPDQIHGLPTRDAENRWFATALSSFGIVYNNDQCQRRGIAAPQTWKDLADPRFFGWIAVADPAASGSHRHCMMLILQHEGWTDGWGTIIRIIANARTLASGSTDALHQVRTGYCLAGFAVNFDGMAWAADSGGVMKYVRPEHASAVSPDVVSVLKSSPNADVAADFVRFCLSREGQAIWSVAQQHRSSLGDNLYHYPIAPIIYQEYAGKLSVTENPFETDFGVGVDLKTSDYQAQLLAPLVTAACGANHVLLQQAWKAVIESGMAPDALAALTAPPIDEANAASVAARYQEADAEETHRMVDQWAEEMAARFNQVIDLCRR